ncbi:MAG: DUF4912 domain-containing protein [Opitutaceae bacterium]|nr:DUF4912 domain-containing protein [Verrucomicrobiales bacterium]
MKPDKKASQKKTVAVTPKVSTAGGKKADSPTTVTQPKAAEGKVIAKESPKASSARPPVFPEVLLEGDSSPSAKQSGPGQRYVLGPARGAEQTSALADLGELPDSYGTKRLLLTARDPHWLYAHWDLTAEQLKQYNSLSADGHLVLKVYRDSVQGEPLNQIHVHPESRNWFVHVGVGGTRFTAELGYFANQGGKWVGISTSGSTLTPPDALSEDTSVRFATIPIDVPFEKLVELVKAALRDNVPLAEAILQLRAQGHPRLPGPEQLAFATWTPAQAKAMAQLITLDSERRVWMGSLEITELIRRQLLGELSSMAAAQFSQPTSPTGGVTSLSSPFGGMDRRKGFWFNVNAELIIYGATEPDATVTMGGRKIQLRPDGTFSYRFKLPDGEYSLPAVATSADGDDSRSAHLEFARKTEYRGDVGAHPQDSRLQTPHVSNVV